MSIKNTANSLFIIFFFIYLGIVGGWFFRFPISYKLTNGTTNELVVDHDFTAAEREGVKKAYHIRRNISNILFFSSILFSLSIYISLQLGWLDKKRIVRITLYSSVIIAIILMIVHGIGFIPGPPVR